MSKNKKFKERIVEAEAILDQLDFTTEDYSEACKKMKGEYRRFIKVVLNELGTKDNSKILEIGPGPGWIGIMMAQMNPTFKIIGLELSEDMIRVAKKNVIDEGVESQVSFIHGNAEDMNQFSNNSFDVVISNGSLHHWVNPKNVFNEIIRVVKDKGIFCVSDGRRDINYFAKIIFHSIKLFMPQFMRLGWKTSIMAGYIPEELKSILDQSKVRNKYEIKTDLFDLIVKNK